MHKKHQRLTGKDIQYMLKKAKRRAGEHFLIYYLPQYPNRPYAQRAMSISTKIDKRATQRNYLKRVLTEKLVAVMQPTSGRPPRSGQHRKMFILPHKKHHARRKQLIASQDKTSIRTSVQARLEKDLQALSS